MKRPVSTAGFRYAEPMDDIDLNLLTALDALLEEGSVTGAARRLGLSASAMSRTLARLRGIIGDPLLVRAGRGLVPTPRAAEIRDRVHVLARDARAVLRPQADRVDLATIARTFTIRASEGFVDLFAAPLVAALTAAAPRIRLRFSPKPDKHSDPLREGEIDLEIGVLGAFAPEVRTQLILRDGFVGAARADHPLLAAPLTAERYAACDHVVASRRGRFTGPVDEALRQIGLERNIVVVVPGFPDAMRIARRSDLIALVPRSCLHGDDPLAMGLTAFALPVPTPEIQISAMWHPRMDADPGHRWLRETVIAVCRRAAPSYAMDAR
ncbi:LysR family transcriptional regulator [Sphingomonas abietis]|uniref:LysR family transcriptional regulator n=1 Tax=Sphingomonas abietis TaxID=3012344 RepID=A0ABY7NSE1_9SPHN|nr:LysR family transcriptional regulator [Sphingomonas abietis]WBO23715.1 LysR family transcriptional regulator [Sphingomonas abietis]